MEFSYLFSMKRPIEKIDFESFEDITKFSKVLKKKVDKGLLKNDNSISFKFKDKKFKIDLNNLDFYLGYIYGFNYCNSKNAKVKLKNKKSETEVKL
mgnify:CR=1 FL=1